MPKLIPVLVLAALIAVPVAFAQNAPAPAPQAWTEDNRWQEIVTDADAKRLANMPETRAAALREAEASPQFAEIAPLVDAPTEFGTTDQLLGSWRCRTIKMGGLLPLTIYSYFDCAIRRDGDSLIIEKTSGSQLFTAALYPSAVPGEFVQIGADHYAYEAPRAYGDDPQRNQIGLLRQLGPDHLLLELPKPVLESNHDWIELVR